MHFTVCIYAIYIQPRITHALCSATLSIITAPLPWGPRRPLHTSAQCACGGDNDDDVAIGERARNARCARKVAIACTHTHSGCAALTHRLRRRLVVVAHVCVSRGVHTTPAQLQTSPASESAERKRVFLWASVRERETTRATVAPQNSLCAVRLRCGARVCVCCVVRVRCAFPMCAGGARDATRTTTKP